jgi:hypothetical protein
MADAAFDPLTNSWRTPSAWSVSALFEHRLVPAFYVDLEDSIGGLNWSNQGSGCPVFGDGYDGGQFVAGGLSPHATSWIICTDLGWNPAAKLNFNLELMYEHTIQENRSGLVGTVNNWDGQNEVGATFAPGLERRQQRLRRPPPDHPVLLKPKRTAISRVYRVGFPIESTSLRFCFCVSSYMW